MAELIACPLAAQAQRTPQAMAVYGASAAACLDYAGFDRLVSRLADALQGVLRGQVLLVAADNGLPLLALIWAALRRGILLCPINPRWPASQLGTLARQVDAAAVWVADPCAALADLPCPRLALPTPEQLLALPAAASTPDQPQRDLPQVDSQALANLTLTSGSTGTPKAVAHRLAAHLANARGSASRLPLQPGDGWLLSLPLWHVGGYAIAMRCVLAGACVVLPHPALPLADWLRQAPISHLSLVPTQLWRLLAAGLRFGETRLQHLLLGGAPIPAALVAACQAQGLQPWVSYGLSEMASQVCTGRASAGHPAVGLPLPGRELRLVAGEIQVRGETLFAGYYQTDGSLQRPLTADGWLATGDLGHWHPVQGLTVTGRRDNRFVCGGENIQPELIEQQLIQHPQITQALVVPVADAEWGMRPVALIAGTPDAGSIMDDLPALADWLRPHLPGYLIPRRWLAWPHHLTNGLKPNRKLLADWAARQLAGTASTGVKTAV